eukprot:6438410-Alexandrium_andersonii.AAC.1
MPLPSMRFCAEGGRRLSPASAQCAHPALDGSAMAGHPCAKASSAGVKTYASERSTAGTARTCRELVVTRLSHGLTFATFAGFCEMSIVTDPLRPTR